MIHPAIQFIISGDANSYSLCFSDWDIVSAINDNILCEAFSDETFLTSSFGFGWGTRIGR